MKHQYAKLLATVLRYMWVTSTIYLAVCSVVIRRFLDLLELCKLLQMKLVHLTVDHRSYCKIADDVLKQDECSHDDGDSAFQWRDYCRLVEQQEKNKRRLQQQRQQPESS